MNLEKCGKGHHGDENERTQCVLFLTVEFDGQIRYCQEQNVCQCNSIGLQDKKIDENQDGTNNDCVHINKVCLVLILLFFIGFFQFGAFHDPLPALDLKGLFHLPSIFMLLVIVC